VRDRWAGYRWGVCIVAPVLLFLASCRSAGEEPDHQIVSPGFTAYMCELAFRTESQITANGKPQEIITVGHGPVAHGNVPAGVGIGGVPVSNATYMRLVFSFTGGVHGGLAPSNGAAGVAFDPVQPVVVYLEAIPKKLGQAPSFNAFLPASGGSSYRRVQIPFRQLPGPTSADERPARRFLGWDTQAKRWEAHIEIEMKGLAGVFIHYG